MSDMRLIPAVMFAPIMIFLIFAFPLKYGMPFPSPGTVDTRKIYLEERGSEKRCSQPENELA